MFKKILLAGLVFYLIVLPGNSLGQEEDSDGHPCGDDGDTEVEKLREFGTFRTLEDSALETPLLFSKLGRLCEGELAANESNWENALKLNIAGRWNKTLVRFQKEKDFNCYLKHAGSDSEPVALPEGEFSERLGKYLDFVYQCEALIAMSGHSDLKNHDVRSKSVQETSSMTQNMEACQNHPNPAQCMAIQQGQQGIMGAQLRCRHNGVETQDYSACKKIVRTIDGFFIAKQANKSIQEVRAVDHQQEEQMKLQQKAFSGQGVSNKDALGSQKSSVEQQSRLAYERAALDGAQLATITAMYQAMPDKESLYKECKEADIYNQVNQFVGASHNPLPSLYDSSDEICHNVISKYAGHALLLNQEAKDAIKLVIAKSTLSAVENVAKGKLLSNQANRIQEAIDGIEEKEKPDLSHHFAGQELFQKCQLDPSAEGCPKEEGTQKTHDMINTQFSFGGVQGNADGGRLNETPEAGDRSIANTPSGGRILPDRIGQINSPRGNNDNDFLDPPPRPGRAKKGEGGGGGGGGAGGGAGSASLARGGDTPGAGGPQGGSGGSGKRDVKLNFSGSGAGALRLSGGNFNNGKKKPAPKNPFDKLFGKNKKKNKGNDVLSFKKGVGKKDKSIFTMLSQRYDTVVKNKRLLKYEIRESK